MSGYKYGNQVGGGGGNGTDAVARAGIQGLTAKLEEKETELRTTQSNPTNFNGAIFSIIDDDARPNFRTVWQPILDANPDVKIGIAVVKDWTLDGSALSLSELHTLQENGHDLLCHTTHHVPSYEITPENAELDYPEASQWMKDNGLKGYDTLVYPGGLSPSAVNIKNVARKNFKYAVSTEAAGDYAIAPVDNWCIGRINGDAKTLDQLKAAVDTAKANGHWLILMTHSHVLLSAGSQKMADLIAYVKSQNVPIMPYSEAIKYKGNALALGEYTDPKSTFVSVKGEMKKGANPSIVASTTNAMDTLLTGYENNAITVQNLTYVKDTFLNVGGVLITYRINNNDYYGYQEFTPDNTNDKYIRKWDNTNKVWKFWSKMNANLIFKKYSEVVVGFMDRPITDYPVDSITYVPLSYVRDTYKNAGGTMIVYRGEASKDDYAYAEFVSMASPFTKHIRRWDVVAGAWKAWSQI